MLRNLEQALHTIKSTMYHHNNPAYFPYFFIVGAGISVPEIPAASKIVDICKETVKSIDPDLFIRYDEESKSFSKDGMKYYSSWIEYAYPNRINRSELFKDLCNKAKISSANLMLAQILHSGEFANTVFTTNFDDSIKKALELMGTKNFFCAENAMDNLVVSNQTKDIQVVHVHGTFNFYDCANLEKEIDNIATQTGTISSTQLLSSFLSNQAPIIVGYSGWENDAIMRCLAERLRYPTPLQYIWVCYNKQSYMNLPNWIKENDSVIFVIPELNNELCNESGDDLAWDTSSNDSSIDATMFFKRIISGFKLKTPLIFADPYSYYSEKIKSILPKDEDVLHLKHWAQRLKIIESDDIFEELVQELETLYIAKDYVRANNILHKMIDLQLSEANAEFVCSSLIKEFIRDEDVIPSFEDRYIFHLTALAFVEKNIVQLSNTKSLASTLRAILFTKFGYEDKDKVLELIEKIIILTTKDRRLLVVELTALGLKSDFVNKDLKISMLEEILERCPKETRDKEYVFLKYKALRELARVKQSNDSIALIEQAEQMANILGKIRYNVYLCITKLEVFSHIDNNEIKEHWWEDVISALSVRDDEIDTELYIELASNIGRLCEDEIFSYTGANTLEEIVISLMSEFSVDHSSCHSILHYSQCCELICRITKTEAILAEFCRKAFDVMGLFPHKCKGYLITLKGLLYRYLGVSTDVVSDSDKIDILRKIKGNENTNHVYLSVLYYAYAFKLINDFSVFADDIDYINEKKEYIKKGYELYLSGKHKEAEELFVEVIACDIQRIADHARTNLLYMIRRNETINRYEFEDVLSDMAYYSAFDTMNILLYYTSKGQTDGDKYLKAKEEIESISEEERTEIIEWWSNVDLVGEEESEIALSFVNKSL